MQFAISVHDYFIFIKDKILNVLIFRYIRYLIYIKSSYRLKTSLSI